MPLSLTVLASSSEANSYVVSSGRTHLLVDAGLSCEQTRSRMLQQVGYGPEFLDGVLVTHGHVNDHCKGVDQLVRSYRMPVYCSEGTKGMILAKAVHTRAADIKAVRDPFQIGDIKVTPFDIVHDIPEPFGYRFETVDATLGIATDLGTITDSVREGLAGCDLVFLEANYDEDLLRACGYDPMLKTRVYWNHLSNEEVALFIANDLAPNCQVLVLGHLSTATNSENIARLMAEHALNKRKHPARLIVGETAAAERTITVTKINKQSEAA